MADEPEQHDDIDKALAELNDRAFEFLNKGYDRTSVRIFCELQRKAKAEKRLIHYIDSLFLQMNVNQSLFEPQMTQQQAIELIGLLENPDRARVIQSDYPENVYEYRQAWMTPCLYENLADAAGTMQGFNSEGMHACIGDGLQVCRTTGKMSCVRCFREYATDVYLAADDLFMALHQSNSVLNSPIKEPDGWPDRGDRRWVGARNVAKVLLLQGQLDAAEASLNQAYELCQGEHVVHDMMNRYRLTLNLQTVRLLAGTADLTKTFDFPLPVNESPFYDLRWARNEALRHTCAKNYDAAQDLLADWDRRLLQKNCISDWFEVRLRLIALQKLAGREPKVEALTKPLVDKAKKARDFLTLHRLDRLLDPAETPTPLALLAPLTSGLFASAPAQAAVPDVPPPGEQTTGEQPTEPPPTPMQEFIGGLFRRLQEKGEDADELDRLTDEVLGVDLAHLTEPNDTAWLMYLLLFTSAPGPRVEAIWNWVETVAAPHPQNAAILNLHASLGDLLRGLPESPLVDRISLEDIERRFKLSLELEPNSPRGHLRAGDFFLRQGNLGEAERCLARGFRLSRDNAFGAQKLAEVYERTDRPRDALAVLDLCLREGCPVPDVAWNAALKAHALEQYEALLTYINRFDELVPDQPWANYYRTLALLETSKPQEALAALAAEERIIPEHTFPVAALRACAYAMVGDVANCRAQVEAVLAVRMVSIDYMTVQGVTNTFSRLWKAVAEWPEDDALLDRLRTRTLETGLAPEEVFERPRQRGETQENIFYYRCTLRQELDESWKDFPGCLAHQVDWTDFQQMWGVLAPDEDEAARRVLEENGRHFFKPAELVNCEILGENFTDKPGVVWQGERWHEELTNDN